MLEKALTVDFHKDFMKLAGAGSLRDRMAHQRRKG